MKNRVLGKPKKLTYFALFLLEFFCSHQLQIIIDKRVLEINAYLHDEKTSILFKLFELIFFEFVCFPWKSSYIHEISSDFVNNKKYGKLVGNRQTRKKIFTRAENNKNFVQRTFVGSRDLTKKKKIEMFKGTS